MAQLTAMQTLFTNLESIDIKVPQGIKDVYLQMEKEQIIKYVERWSMVSRIRWKI